MSSYELSMELPKNETSASQDLPTHPSKGDRRRLDGRWLDRLGREGLGPSLVDEGPPPPELGLSVVQFNQGAYWQCHETLERVWLTEGYPLRLFYHGLIKAAVGLLHLERRNRRGAALKLHEAEHTLAPFLPQFMGIDIERLRRDTSERLTYLEVNGPVDWEALGRLPPVRIVPLGPQGG